MDKYEYQVCADQIKSLSSEGRYAEAMDIADTIDWRRVKSFSMLCTVSEIYKVNKHYDESRDILLLAYERYPDRASVIYALCELDIKLGDIKEAKAFYKEYVALKPTDTNRYVLLYRLYEAMDYTLEEKISLLEEFKRAEYTEKWAYELALLYHKTGQERKCVETCDELILWFGDGPYVRKAMELKMQHANLNDDQQRKYDGTGAVQPRTNVSYNQPQPQTYQQPLQNTQPQQVYGNDFQNTQPQAYSQPVQPEYQNMQNQAYDPYNQAGYMTGPYQPQGYDSYGQTGAMNQNQPVYEQPYGNQPQYGQQSYQPAYDGYQGIQVQPVSTGKYSTINLQEELARNMQEFYNQTNNEQPQPVGYYGSTSSLYEPSQQEYMQQLESTGSTPVMDNQEAYYTGEVQMGYEEEYPNNEPAQEQMTEMPVPVMAESEVVVPNVEINKVTPIEEPVKQEMEITVSEVKTVEPVEVTIKEEPIVDADKSMEKNLSQEYNGQISMALPDPDVEVKQITGQIDISDFLKEWEAKKENAKQQSFEATRRRQIEQTNDIMAQLAGVIPGIEIPKPEKKEPEFIIGPIQKEEVVHSDEQGTLTKTTLKAPSYDEDRGVKRTETGSIINGGPVKSGITGAIPNALSTAGIPAVGVAPRVDINPESTIEESPEREAPKEEIPKEEVPKREEPKEVKPIKVPDYILEQIASERGENIEETAEESADDTTDDITEEVDNDVESELETSNDEVVTVSADENEAVTDNTEIEDEADSVDNSEEEISKDDEDEAVDEVSDEPSNEISDEDDLPEDAPVKYPFDVTDTGEVEEIEEIEQSDEVDDILKTGAIPLFDLDQIESENDSEEEEDKKPSVPSYMVLEERREARREFFEDELSIFGRYDGIESLKAQIVDVMDDMSMDAAYGNVVVTGSEIYGRKSLAIDIVKAMQSFDSNFTGKVAKISGEALNKKDIPMTLHKLHNGALIVENAGGLSPLTVNTMTECLEGGAEPILVVLEDERDAMEPLLTGCKEMEEVFSSRIEMEDFSNEDFVSYARGYAREQEYSIDEMGELALHTRISELQSSLDGIVTIEDIKDMVDAAIKHVDKKNMGHFMDVVLGNRYDDDDYIILREKDFTY